MKIQLLVGLVFLLLSCAKKQEGTEVASGELSPSSETKDHQTNHDDCQEWLKDSTLLTGDYIRYIKEKGQIQIEWGNKKFSRHLVKLYECDGATTWIPTIEWSTSFHIGLHYGCGSPCWGTIILPLNENDSVINRMYDLEKDIKQNLIVYLGGADYDKLTVENWLTGKKQTIKTKVNCGPSFLGYCIDSVKFVDDKLFIKWNELDEAGKSKGKIDELVKLVK